jgi:hypothetical protein
MMMIDVTHTHPSCTSYYTLHIILIHSMQKICVQKQALSNLTEQRRIEESREEESKKGGVKSTVS